MEIQLDVRHALGCNYGLVRVGLQKELSGGMEVKFLEGDLLDQDVDVIVNAWNRNIIPWWLLLPQGVSGAIKKRGGYAPFRELGKKGPIPLGGAVETGPGKLPYKAIIHVAGINMLWRSSERSIRDSVRNATRLASERGYQSIAFPLIGSGSGGGKPERVLEIMRDELVRIEFDGRGANRSVQERDREGLTNMADIKNPRLLYAKGTLFVLGGIMASGLILAELTHHQGRHAVGHRHLVLRPGLLLRLLRHRALRRSELQVRGPVVVCRLSGSKTSRKQTPVSGSHGSSLTRRFVVRQNAAHIRSTPNGEAKGTSPAVPRSLPS